MTLDIETGKRHQMMMKKMVDDFVDRWYQIEDKPRNEQVRAIIAALDKMYFFGRDSVLKEQAAGIKAYVKK